ncbi:MAG: hypothetical protein DRP11_02220 [Candidatus Aenigmatarchaeota archaeon]|nr:MAG: hypothetical protein DRP11_02220 [Candidatus Aenigmarchaeota archaeon]
MLSIVIPTYNEAENIEELIRTVEGVLERNGIDGEIIVVDDTSPDGTGRIVERLTKEYGNLILVERKEKCGIGAAYKTGFRVARGGVIMEMDADFSHDPEDIPKLYRKIKGGYDVVVGSRYVEGGERKDPIHRRIFPLIGNFLYVKLLGSGVRDTTAGFRAYRREVLKKVDLDSLPDDFSFQAAILFRLRGAKMTEVPIKFRERRAGEPKYGFKDLLGNIRVLLSFLFKK